jgi:hypothetical protein
LHLRLPRHGSSLRISHLPRITTCPTPRSTTPSTPTHYSKRGKTVMHLYWAACASSRGGKVCQAAITAAVGLSSQTSRNPLYNLETSSSRPRLVSRVPCSRILSDALLLARSHHHPHHALSMLSSDMAQAYGGGGGKGAGDQLATFSLKKKDRPAR